ncbi:MAG TPA: zinc ribbon domain-containing protein [Anaerolineae bacterium]|nr:zinc ribbon domain-containing protein [Anaerolineae bacterium]
MSVGAILVGAALTLLVGAYLARPFRRMRVEPDRAIEYWVAQVRERGGREARAQGRRGVEGPVNFCPQCGRRVGPEDRFCAGCGTRLRED